ARGHDVEALGEIYRRYVRRVFGLCRYMLDSRERAEDATSEVFVKLQRSIESYDGSIPFPSWLLRVAGNQCIDALRRQRRGRQVIVDVDDGATAVEAPSAEPSPLAAVMSKEERAQVRDANARLPENYRLPLALRYYSEVSYDEIAQQLDLQRNYVAAADISCQAGAPSETGPPEQVSYGMLFGTDVQHLRGRRTSRGRSAAPARPPGHVPALPGTGGRIAR